jgi:hypothetical protein
MRKLSELTGFHSSDALQTLDELGDCHVHHFDDRAYAILLPSRTASIQALNPTNWLDPLECGNSRSVIRTDKQRAPESFHLMAKAPEQRFTGFEENILDGKIWWGGKRSTDRHRYVDLSPGKALTELTRWEAASLLTLWNARIPVEHPECIIEYADGKSQVVVSRFDPGHLGSGSDSLKEDVARTGLRPEDFQTLEDRKTGVSRVIDVARWIHPESSTFRTEFGRVLLGEVKQKFMHSYALQSPRSMSPDPQTRYPHPSGVHGRDA